MVTLFTLMVVNNWMVQVAQYVYVLNGVTNANVVRLYFLSFYYFSVILGINLVIAFVLDMYSSTERLEDEREKTMVLIEKEMSGQL